jgi:hypothetical protein
MDYEVFILSRMREEYDRTGSTEQAVIRGIGRTGRLVTSAALILFLAFVAMASGPGAELKMAATALAIGILLGVGLAYLVEPGLDLRALAAGREAPLEAPLLGPALLAAALLLVTALAALLTGAAARRISLSRVLRMGER